MVLCLWSPRLALVSCCCCLRSPTSPAAVYCIMGSYYVMSPPPLRRQTRRINCKDNCVSCGFRKPAAGTSNCHCGCQAVKGRESPGTAFLLSILYSSWRNNSLWFIEWEKYLLQLKRERHLSHSELSFFNSQLFPPLQTFSVSLYFSQILLFYFQICFSPRPLRTLLCFQSTPPSPFKLSKQKC